MAHANARLTVHGRLLLVRRVTREGKRPAHVARELGVSRKTVYSWLARYRAEGIEGLRDRPSRPRTSPRRTPSQVEGRVLAARRQLRVGPARIAQVTGVPACRCAR